MRLWFTNLRGDLTGGGVSAAVAVPLALGYGMFAFVALGDEYFADGARAGLITAFVVGVASVLLGDKTPNVYAPRVTSTFFIGALLYQLVHSDMAIAQAGNLPVLLAIVFSIVVLAGAFQLLFGLVGLGTLIKYTPHPVMAGFQNAAAVLLFLVQLGNVMGFARSTPFMQALRHVLEAKPLSVLVAVLAFVAMWNAKRVLPRIPPLIVGLMVGTATYYALVLAGLERGLGPTIAGSASLPVASVLPDYAELVQRPDLLPVVPTIIGGALALALVASIDALLCAKLVTRAGDPKVNGDRLLVRLGIGNVLAGFMGGITGGLNLGPSLANRAFGGRTPASVLVNASVVLLTFALLFPVLRYLPRAVLSSVIMVIAVQHIDPWTVQMTRRLASGATGYRRRISLELCVVLLVATLSIVLNIVVAVFIGVTLATMLFLVQMSRSIIRRMYRCDAIRARKSRTAAETEVLERSGAKILVIELQGALFFGTAEKLANEIAAQGERDTRCVILELRRITEIDSTGAQILHEIHADLAAAGRHLVVCLAPASQSSGLLVDTGLVDTLTADRIFRDVDRAIEWAEDDLLNAELPDAPAEDSELPLERVSLMRDFHAPDLAAIRRHLTRVAHPVGHVMFQQGEPGSEVYFIVRGTASALLRQADGGAIRLLTFAPGTVFGELAILDQGVRSATVIAEQKLVCYVLTLQGFALLSAAAPDVAIKLLANLGRELSRRLRQANRTIQQLEE